MALLICWLVFPVALGALSLGCGLLVERISGIGIPGTLLLPTGLAAIVVIAQFAVWTDATAELATPAVVLLAVAGALLSRRRLTERRPDLWAAGAAAGVFVAFGATVLMSGTATFNGYVRLDDTVFWLVITDHVMEHGRDLGSLATSSYEAWLREYVGHGYPIGTFLPLGVGRAVVGQDVAWVFPSYIAFLAAMLSLGLYELVGRVREARPARALVAFIAAQPAILFGWALIGGVKEVMTAALLALLATLAIQAALERTGWRGLLPLAVATAAIVDAVSYGAALWLLPILVPALVLAIRLRGAAPVLRQAGLLAVLAVALFLPAIPAMADFLSGSPSILTSSAELGALPKALSPLQLFGIWPVGDFRFRPGELAVADIMVMVVIGAAIAGIALAWQLKSWSVLAYVGAAAVGCLAISAFGAPWVDAKSFAIAAPAFLLAAFVGASALGKWWDPVATDLISGVIVVGVLWSNGLAYHGANLAPRDRLKELQQIGQRIEGEGPTLMTEYEIYSRHFLRKGNPRGASEGKPPPLPLASGGTPYESEYRDIDAFRLNDVLKFRSLVLGRSPTVSRPPSPYRLVWSGRFYELWQRTEPASPLVQRHVPLGDTKRGFARTPVSKPSCRELVHLARGTSRLATVVRSKPFVLDPARFPHPKNWLERKGDPTVLYPEDSGTMTFSAKVPEGRYRFWVGRAFRRKVQLYVDGRQIASRSRELQVAGQYMPMGERQLANGSHDIELRYGSPFWKPGVGNGDEPFALGPLILSDTKDDRSVVYLNSRDARTLCGRQLDWVEAVGP